MANENVTGFGLAARVATPEPCNVTVYGDPVAPVYGSVRVPFFEPALAGLNVISKKHSLLEAIAVLEQSSNAME